MAVADFIELAEGGAQQVWYCSLCRLCGCFCGVSMHRIESVSPAVTRIHSNGRSGIFVR